MCPNSSEPHSKQDSPAITHPSGRANRTPNPRSGKGVSFWVGASVLSAMLVVAFPCAGGGGKKKHSPNRNTGGDGGALPLVEDAYGLIKASSDTSVQPLIASDALFIEELGGSFVFVDGGWYAEFYEGGGRITGALRSVADPELNLMLSLELDSRFEPGEVGLLTQGPILELSPTAYESGGGRIDPSEWIRWEGLVGTLDGMGLYRGLRYELALGETPLQVGHGANGRNTSLGLTLEFNGTRVQDAPGAPAMATAFEGARLRADVRPSTLFCADGSEQGRALSIEGLADDFVVVSRASFLERLDGTAVLRANLAQRAHPDRGFQLTLTLDGRVSGGTQNYPPEGSPLLGLAPVEYVAGGGDVNPASWRYYRGSAGALEGLGLWEGAQLTLKLDGPAAQIGLGANGENQLNGMLCRYEVEVVDLPDDAPDFAASFGLAELRMDLPLVCGNCPGGGCAFFSDAAEPDSYATTSDQWCLELPGIGTFAPFAGGTLTAQLDGSARYTALLVDSGDPSRRFHLDAIFSDRVAPGDAAHAGLEPVLELDPSAYVAGGGPVDPSSWTFWRQSDAVLTGVGDLSGALYFLELRSGQVQYGVGASGRNVLGGLRASMRAELQNQPDSGPGLPALIQGCRLVFHAIDSLWSCADGSIPDAATGTQRGKSLLSLPGIGATFILQDSANFRESDDGRAKVIGTFVDSQDSQRRFSGQIDLAGRIDPGTLGHPPRSSPQANLPADFYVEAGGPADPAGWYYYQELFGSLTGEGDFAGAHILISREGASFQVGLGATDENLEFGGSGGFQMEVTSQPTSGPALAETAGGGVLRLILSPKCE